VTALAGSSHLAYNAVSSVSLLFRLLGPPMHEKMFSAGHITYLRQVLNLLSAAVVIELLNY
jgi:hypothetical protein